MNTLPELSLPRILSPSIASDPHIISLAESINPNLQAIAPATSETLILARIDSLSEQMLDLLAWQFHADFYDLAYNIEVKRRMIKSAIKWHLHKGTTSAILEALRLLDIQAKFVHWRDFSGEPYTFQISAVVAGDFYRTRGKDKLASSIRRAVSEAKAERSLMVKLDIHINEKERVGLYAAVVKHQTIDISIGVDQVLMHELLLIFERKILDRVTSCFSNISNKLDGTEQRINQALSDSERQSVERLDSCEGRIVEHLHLHEREQDRRLTEYQGEVNSQLSDYSKVLNDRLQELRADISELREILTWKG